MYNDGDKTVVFFGFILGFVFLFGVLLGVGIGKGTSITEEQVIKNNCAQYNPITGSFEWIEKEKAE